MCHACREKATPGQTEGRRDARGPRVHFDFMETIEYIKRLQERPNTMMDSVRAALLLRKGGTEPPGESPGRHRADCRHIPPLI